VTLGNVPLILAISLSIGLRGKPFAVDHELTLPFLSEGDSAR
jgi:hypothetical protein